MGLLCGPSLGGCAGWGEGFVLTGLGKSAEDIESRHFKRSGLGGARTHKQRLKRAHSALCKSPLIRCLYITLLSCSASVALEQLLPWVTSGMRCQRAYPEWPTGDVTFNTPMLRTRLAGFEHEKRNTRRLGLRDVLLAVRGARGWPVNRQIRWVRHSVLPPSPAPCMKRTGRSA